MAKGKKDNVPKSEDPALAVGAKWRFHDTGIIGTIEGTYGTSYVVRGYGWQRDYKEKKLRSVARPVVVGDVCALCGEASQ